MDAFNFYYGTGARVTQPPRAPSYRNQDLSLVKNTSLGQRDQPAAAHRGLQRLELAQLQRLRRVETASRATRSAFTTDLASPDFGRWNGGVSNPRVIQLAARLEF